MSTIYTKQATPLSRLPPELWDKIFSYLMPEKEVALEKWSGCAPRIRWDGKEDPKTAETMDLLSKTPHLLFPGSRYRYWCLLILNATWVIKTCTRDSRNPSDDLIHLQDFFGFSVRRILALIGHVMYDKERPWDDTSNQSSDDLATTASTLAHVTKVLKISKDIKKFTIRVHLEDRLVDDDHKWARHELTSILLEEPEHVKRWRKVEDVNASLDSWTAAWIDSGIVDFQVLIRYYKWSAFKTYHPPPLPTISTPSDSRSVSHPNIPGPLPRPQLWFADANITAIWTHAVKSESKAALKDFWCPKHNRNESLEVIRRLKKCKNRPEDRVLIDGDCCADIDDEDTLKSTENAGQAEERIRRLHWHCECGAQIQA